MTKITKLIVTKGVAAALLTCPAIAQENPLLEEIIVTAQKREQNLQEVPVSVAAFNGATLERANVKDIFDLENIAPGLRAGQNQVASTANFSIRGVGTSSSNFGLESSVGLYVDGAYRSRQSAIINNLVDIEAIEVLRGPQGTLFGKNTPSGAVLIRTRKPSHEPDGFLDLNVGNYSLTNISGAYGSSLIEDVLAWRVSAFNGERDGIVNDIFRGEDTINDRNRFGIQGQLLYTPNNDIEVRFIADYSEIDEVCCAAVTLVDSLVANRRTDAMGNPIPGTDALLRALGATTTTSAQFEDYNMALSQLPRSENEDSGFLVQVDWDRQDYTLTSITAFRSFETQEAFDADFSNIDLFSRIDNADQSSFSQELRISGDFSERLRYLGGLYYFTQDLDNDTTTSTGNAFTPYTLLLALQELIDGINFASMATGGLVPPPTAPFTAPLASSLNQMRQEHESWAIFGQLDFDLTDQLMLTAGLRYTDEEKKLNGTFTQSVLPGSIGNGDAARAQLTLLQLATVGDPANSIPPDPSLLVNFNPAVFAPYTEADWGYRLFDLLAPRPEIDTTLKDEQLTGTLKLSWRVNDDVLLYASYATGFKSGGTNTDRINMALDPVFDAETSEAFEIGLKADFPEQRLRVNLAAHQTTVDDFQSNAFQGTGFNLQNAGSLDTYGAELEVWWNPTETLAITAGYVRSVADFDDFDQANCWIAYTFHTGIEDPGRVNPGNPFTGTPPDQFCDRGGDRVSFNPEDFFVLTATQAFELKEHIDGFARIEWSWIGDQMMDANNDPYKLQGSYDLLGLSAGLTFNQWNTEVSLWGRNITDERYYNVVFDVPIQDGRLNAYPGEPRTYGLRLKVSFL